MKQHAEPAIGVVRRLMREDGYGFLEGADGLELYFHRNSVEGDGFSTARARRSRALSRGGGEKGPQASAVRPLGERAPS